MKPTALKRISAILNELPEGVPPVRFYRDYLEALKAGIIKAVPVGESFEIGSHIFKDDLVNTDEGFQKWQTERVRTLQLHRARKGVVAHAEEVLAGAVDFETLAKNYREQLNQTVTVRRALKRPQPKQKRSKPKLPDAPESDVPALQSKPVMAD